MLTLCQVWGDHPMEMWQLYLRLKKEHLPTMPTDVEALQVTHPMTPFYSYRLFDLKNSTRENSHKTLLHVCTLLVLKPMGVYLPINGILMTLRSLRKMILKNRRKAVTARQ